MTELEKIEYTRAFVEKLANGLNPMTGEPVPEHELIRHARVSGCLFYVSDLLRQVIEGGGIRRKPKEKKRPFEITYETLARYTFPTQPIPVSEIARRINDLNPDDNMTKLKYRSITTFLLQAGFLREIETADGKKTKMPTRQGAVIGITSEERAGANGPYTVVVYNEQAQRLILDNIDAILEINAAPKTRPVPAET